MLSGNQRGTMVGKLPKQSLGDVIDKMSILTRKVFFGEEDAVEELGYLEWCLNAMDTVAPSKQGKFVSAIIRLAQMNFEIWNLENEIRKGGEDKFSVEEIGRRSILIRDYNKKRVYYKNQINELTGLGFREFKIKHRSQ